MSRLIFCPEYGIIYKLNFIYCARAPEGGRARRNQTEVIPVSNKLIDEEVIIKDNTGNEPEKRPGGEAVYDIVESVILSVAVIFILFTFIFRICVVDGRSMEDTLYDGENLIVTNLGRAPRRGDIVVFHETGYYNEPLVKRVIAVGGEYVDIKSTDHGLTVSVSDRIDDDGCLVDPEVLTEDYAVYRDVPPRYSYDDYPVYVPEGYLFVLGDNRNHSSDSRFEGLGLIDERRLLGKVVIRVTPFSRFGTVG